MTDEERILPEGAKEDEPGQEDEWRPEEKMSRWFYPALVLVGILILLILFINIPGIKASAGVTMKETSWTLQSYADGTGVLVPAMTDPVVTARFGSGGALTGSSGCNRYAASYTVKDYAVTISPPVATKMSCTGPGIMIQESAFLSDLPKVTAMRISGGNLKLYDASGIQILEFRPTA